ncbi:MAG: molybdenum cofactor guanylyltransferase [Promethearchaeota archaeon]
MSIKEQSIAFVVLIGGKSLRFGTDKGIFEIHGKPMLSYQLDTLKKFKKNIYIIGHSLQQINIYREKIGYNDKVIFLVDNRELIDNPEVRTPMIGLYTAFKKLKQEKIDKTFVFSCDTPLIKHEAIKFMIDRGYEHDCCIPQWRNGFLEPLLAIYPTNKALISIEKCLKDRNYKLINLLDKKWNIFRISIEELIQPLDQNLLTFINVNHPIDLEKLLEQYKKS